MVSGVNFSSFKLENCKQINAEFAKKFGSEIKQDDIVLDSRKTPSESKIVRC
jgi:hypothetical protein